MTNALAPTNGFSKRTSSKKSLVISGDNGFIDKCVAAICLSKGFPVWTRNLPRVVRYPGLSRIGADIGDHSLSIVSTDWIAGINTMPD